jgi:hypothetical protein
MTRGRATLSLKKSVTLTLFVRFPEHCCCYAVLSRTVLRRCTTKMEWAERGEEEALAP